MNVITESIHTTKNINTESGLQIFFKTVSSMTHEGFYISPTSLS